ncbi:MAG: ABC transporter ATP-binding protein [Oscillospiraceae bacterium]|nr:ABC transporter ATP-binding protein [Oscillospiraceae bacterium]
MYFETKDLAVGYNGRPLIEHIDIGIRKGGILCLIGPNGSGKSTILRSITRHLAKLGGVVSIDGRDLSGLSNRALAKQVSVVLTGRVDPELLTCWEVVSAGRYPYTNHFGKLSQADEAIVTRSMEQVSVLELREHPFVQLSDGQKQRVLLARALCQQPEVMVLDEPTSYLDIRHKIELLSILRGLASEQGLTVVLSLHEVDLAVKLADVVVLVKGSTIYRCGAPEDVLDGETLRSLYDIRGGAFDLLLGSVELRGAAGESRVFVVPGAGRGAPCFRALQKRGIPFSTGILQPGGVDSAVSHTLAARTFAAEPFAPPTARTLEEARTAARSAQCVVDSGFPLGPYNRENLELLQGAVQAGVPVLCLRPEPPEGLSGVQCFSTVRELIDEAAKLTAPGR